MPRSVKSNCKEGKYSINDDAAIAAALAEEEVDFEVAVGVAVASPRQGDFSPANTLKGRSTRNITRDIVLLDDLCADIHPQSKDIRVSLLEAQGEQLMQEPKYFGPDADEEEYETNGIIQNPHHGFRGDLRKELDGALAGSLVPKKTHYEVFFVTLPLFMAYACLFALQGELMKEVNKNILVDDTRKDDFQFAVSSLFVGNLIFRFAHNIFFGFWTPRGRTVIAMLSLMLSLSTIVFGIFWGGVHSLYLVSFCYALGGIGVGSFESNMLSSITPLGPNTKLWATLGIPMGVVSITVGGFLFMSWGVPVEFIYLFVVALLGVGIFVFIFILPYFSVKGNGDSMYAFFDNLKMWRFWLPQTLEGAISLVFDMFCLSSFSPGVLIYVFQSGENVELWNGGLSVQHFTFLALYNTCTFMGETISRKLAYTSRKRLHPFGFLIFSVVGVFINVFFISVYRMPIACLFGGFCIMFANGSIYNHTCRKIDETVPKVYNLTALSFWLFLGDFGSIFGSSMVQYIKVWMVGN